MSIRTVKVSNLSLGATEQDVMEFFSFSGDIEYVEMQSDTERSQTAFVTFKDSEGAENALLLSGATIVDLSVTVTLDPLYKLPPAASAPPVKTENKTAGGAGSVLEKAEDVFSSVLAKSVVLGKGAVNKAKSFDEKHHLTSTASSKVATASSKVASIDKKIGFSEKISIGTSAVNEKVRGVDQKLQISGKTKSAYNTAGQKVSSAGSAIMKNRYVFTGASWVTGAFNKVSKTAGEVGQKTKEKVGMAEEERRRKNGG